MVKDRIKYLQRIYKAYLSGEESQLTFWHGTPAVNQEAVPGVLGPYYMPFLGKAHYKAHLDQAGIPMLDYHGTIGLQYNPIAIAQFGLGNYNLFQRTGEVIYRDKFILVANWLRDHLEENRFGVLVWNHHFDFEYQELLRSPWYSGLAQGQGLSVLVRAYQLTGTASYLEAARAAFAAFRLPVTEGGVIFLDGKENIWIEEYIVAQPTHILNGFIWAVWGVYDYFLATGAEEANQLYQDSVKTLRENLLRYDTGSWSLYDLSSLRLQMIASPFYHQLHIVQLKIMFDLTGEEIFLKYAQRWGSYQKRFYNRIKALLQKIVFKIVYY